MRRSVLCLIGMFSLAQFATGFALLMQQDPASIGLGAQQDSVAENLDTIIAQKHAALMLDKKL